MADSVPAEVERSARRPSAAIFATKMVVVATFLLAHSAEPAHADLTLCNRTSYVLDLALGLESKDAAATRGWFRTDPGQCRVVLQGTIEATHVYVRARSHPVYHQPPLPQAQHVELCIADDDFVIAGARKCPSSDQRLAAFTEIKPSETDDGFAAHLSELAEYTPDQARLAGVQRLLVAIGYDAEPIDGIEGKKTEAALAQFLADRRLSATVEPRPLFDALLEAARQTGAAGFSWCNETPHVVMAALGFEEKGRIITRGWYRVAAGRCLKPDMSGKPRRLYSFAEAIDADGRVIHRADKPLAWKGPVVLCTRELKFEIADHRQCTDRGLLATGFAAVELDGRGTVVRFKE